MSVIPAIKDINANNKMKRFIVYGSQAITPNRYCFSKTNSLFIPRRLLFIPINVNAPEQITRRIPIKSLNNFFIVPPVFCYFLC